MKIMIYDCVNTGKNDDFALHLRGVEAGIFHLPHPLSLLPGPPLWHSEEGKAM
jgi:hypothetical protein